MTTAPHQIAALLGSRICHDLISPIGAISNGVELMQMSSDVSGPEVELISESVENANARIRFFRIAFGVASVDQMVGAKEIRDTLDDLTKGSRLSIDWQSHGDEARRDVKILFLLIQCFEAAMPWGGQLTIESTGSNWVMSGTSDRMKIDPDLWATLENMNHGTDIGAAEVQFLLLPVLLQETQRTLHVETSATGITVRL